jgi:pentatricopeptide repeat protein
MLSTSRAFLRGYAKPELVNGDLSRGPVRRVGAVPRIRPTYTSLNRQKPQRLMRAVVRKCKTKLPVLWQRQDQIIELQNALVVRRHEMQVLHTTQQLSLTLRNADDFVQKHLLDNKHRPTLHTLWFHERGLQRQQHVVSLMPSHTMIPFISLLATDFEKKRCDIEQVEQVYHAMSESLVAHDAIVKRELCNTMIRCYVLDGELQKALTIVHDMKANGVRRNFVTYAPLFRHARNNMDVELDDEIRDLIHEVEGGTINKAVFIDGPRVLSLGWVFVRYHWAFIWSCILVVSGLITALVLIAIGIF